MEEVEEPYFKVNGLEQGMSSTNSRSVALFIDHDIAKINGSTNAEGVMTASKEGLIMYHK